MGGGGGSVRWVRGDLVIDPPYPDFPDAADIRLALDEVYDDEADPLITPRIGDSVLLYVDTTPDASPTMRPRLIYTIMAGPGSLTDFPASSTRVVHFNPANPAAPSAGYAAVMTQAGIW